MKIIFHYKKVIEYEGDEGYLAPSFGILNSDRCFKNHDNSVPDMITFITALNTVDIAQNISKKLADFLKNDDASELIVADKFNRKVKFTQSMASFQLYPPNPFRGRLSTKIFESILKHWIIYLQSDTREALVVDI